MFRENQPVDKSSVSQDSAQDLQQSEELNPIYELGTVIHDGIQCRKQGCNVCSPPSEVNAHEEKRRQFFLEAHKGRNARARAKAIERIQTRDDWDPTTDLGEDFGN
jgi:3'-phosphoadenosine 5'-phosphosulfate sulfotransferase (PAPS reductase)/FAD synthetase